MKHLRFWPGRFVFLFIALLGIANASGADNQANWPHWRGSADNGSAAPGAYPVKWDTTNVLWKTPLPGKGCSTPIVWNQRIFLTAPTNGRNAALALDWQGKILWQRELGESTQGKRKDSSGCNPSATTDGHSVFFCFNSGVLAALTPEGQVLWQTNLVTAFGPDTVYWDPGTSPVLTKDQVIMTRLHHGESWVAAFDKADGRLRWKVARNFETPDENDNAYTTPLVIPEAGGETIVVWGADRVTAHAASDGHVLWTCGGFNPRAMSHWPAVASPVVASGLLIVPSGRADRGQPRLDGIRLGGAGDVTATHRVWTREDVGAYVPTPAEYKGRVYVLSDRGELECLEPATGKREWREALPKASASYYASPLIAEGMLYAAREDGTVFVVRVGGRFEILAENKMGEQVIASPVAVPGRLLIRGERHLFCIGAK